MFPQSSKQLQSAQYLQSDIGFKRIVGYYELEIGGMEPKSNIGMAFLRVSFIMLIPPLALTYCRIYMTRQTAAAHHFVLQQMEKIVEKDTGAPLKWQHLHASCADELIGILQWTADQHGGQAKGRFIFFEQAFLMAGWH